MATSKLDDPQVSQEVERCLEMVSISRVFDFEGLWEVVSEVNRDSTTKNEVTPVGLLMSPERKTPFLFEDEPERVKNVAKVKSATGVEEDLAGQMVSPAVLLSQHPELVQQDTSIDEDDCPEDGTEILIIDSMNHIITELFSRKEKDEGDCSWPYNL